MKPDDYRCFWIAGRELCARACWGTVDVKLMDPVVGWIDGRAYASEHFAEVALHPDVQDILGLVKVDPSLVGEAHT